MRQWTSGDSSEGSRRDSSRRGGPDRDDSSRRGGSDRDSSRSEEGDFVRIQSLSESTDEGAHSASRRGSGDFTRSGSRPDRDRSGRRSLETLVHDPDRSWSRTRSSRSTLWNHERRRSSRDSVSIHQNFFYSMNYAYRPSAWGYSPWWYQRPRYSSWHRGTWSYFWTSSCRNRYYYRPRPYAYYPPGYHTYYRRSYMPWGLITWSLGSLIYDTGYYSYHNPYAYYAPPVQTRVASYSYDRPLVVNATELLDAEPEANAEELSTAAFERARESFLADDYPGALKAVDEAIGHTPEDPVLHEFRALTLFALGQYGEAAGVLHPVLASGPGWNAETMLAFYADPEKYAGQLERLEGYAAGNPDSGQAHFLLGYHYLSSGRLEEAGGAFAVAARVEEDDSLSQQLQRLVENSLAEDVEMEDAETVAAPPERAAPVPATSLAGTWHAVSTSGKSIVLTMDAESSFTWNYEGAKDEIVLKGEWSLDEDGLLVLADEDVQMVAEISLEDDHSLRFVLAGGPEGDPGLLFERR